MRMNQTKFLKNAFTFGLHIIVWLLLFLLNFQFIRNYSVKIDLPFHLLIWSIYVIIFYINFILLIPYLLFKRKYIFYIIASLVLLFAGSIAKDYTLQQHHRKFRPELFERPSFPPEKPVFKPDQRPPFPGIRPRREDRFFMFYGLLLVYTISLSIRVIQKWQNDEKHKAAIEKEKIATELSYLKQQVNPHFLFNTLNSIYSLTISTSSKAAGIILKLSSILRYMLYETENRKVKLTEEVNIIKDYIELQRLRLTDKVSVKFELKGETDHYSIPPLLLIPLIENAFKHGVDNINDSFIEIYIAVANDQLEVYVRNRIVRISPDSYQNSGIGIKNIKRRLELLYGNKYVFETHDKDGIFSVTLKLKLTK